MPPFATALTIAAICTGVAVSLPCPKEKFASSCRFCRSLSVGSVPAAAVSPGASSVERPKPRAFAIPKICSPPAACPSLTK